MEKILDNFLFPNAGGENFRYILENSHCTDLSYNDIRKKLRHGYVFNSPCRTLENYESKNVVFEGQLLEENDLTYTIIVKKKKVTKKFDKLSEIKSDYVTKIQTNLGNDSWKTANVIFSVAEL